MWPMVMVACSKWLVTNDNGNIVTNNYVMKVGSNTIHGYKMNVGSIVVNGYNECNKWLHNLWNLRKHHDECKM
jgi:hypothetical protein